VRRHVASDLEHDLGAGCEPEPRGISAPPHSVDEHGHLAPERREPVPCERLTPDSEQRTKRRQRVETHDAARIERPDARTAAGVDDLAEAQPRPLHSDRCGHDHDASVREELDVHALPLVEPRGPAGEVRGRRPGRRHIPWALADRNRRRSPVHERDREQKREHRLHGTRLTASLLLVVTLAAGLGARVARADGDPASDYLIGQKVFLSYDAKIPKASQQKLLAAVESANAQGFRVKVALIWTSYDLGAVPQLFRKPRYYARFLDTEDSYWLKTTTRLIVVMPNGLGFAQWKHDPSAGNRALSTIKVTPTPAGMTEAATTAVVKLAAAAGVTVSTNGKSSAASAPARGGGGSRTEIVAAVVVALVLGVAARLLIRRRAARSAVD
jgi:hypothetical protein